MAEKANKVKFNLKNTHYALLTIGENGTPTFGTPVPMPGSVSISLDANGEPENFYADGGVYYVINNNCGYDGDLELALIPESFRTDVLKETLDSKGVLIENSEVELAALRSCSSLMATRSTSVMCCITALLHARVSRERRTRTRRKYRRRSFL